jgi:ABC-type sugar transport system permease subunit
MGYAAAISWVLVLMVFALSFVQIKFFNKRLVQY